MRFVEFKRGGLRAALLLSGDGFDEENCGEVLKDSGIAARANLER